MTDQPRKQLSDAHYIALMLDSVERLESNTWLAVTLISLRKYIVRDADVDAAQRVLLTERINKLIDRAR